MLFLVPSLNLLSQTLTEWSRRPSPLFPERPTREGKDMFASIRKYNVRRGSAEHLARRVREGFVPMMRQMEGFRGDYCLMAARMC